jgi:hypothetical protein
MHRMATASFSRWRRLALAAGVSVAAGCASLDADEPPAVATRHIVWAATPAGELLRFNAGTPGRIEQRLRLAGLQPGERLVGLDFRVARGVLYALTSGGRLLTIDTADGATRPVGNAPAIPLAGTRFGFDFNPAADRIRVVSDTGQNLRLHPDTGALAAEDPKLAAAGGPASAVAAAYTYNKRDDKLTTNYALDLARGWLLTQGSLEGAQPVVSPNTGRLFEVGALGTGALDDAAFDIADIDNTALAALRQGGRTRLFRIDLATGRAALVGTVDRGGPLVGLAIEP